MLELALYDYLVGLLERRPRLYPSLQQRAFAAFSPVHLKCHFTAAQAAIEFAEPPILGIQFLLLNTKLYPWPHMVNQGAHGLVDYSPRVDQEYLGFIAMDWNELPHWRSVTSAYNSLEQATGT
jgi:hypothetical protein